MVNEMTAEEVITYLEQADTTVYKEIKTKTAEALEIAIKALKQQPSEDCISREEVKELVVKEFVNPQDGMEEWRNAVNDVVEEILHNIETMPSVTPERPKGKWTRDLRMWFTRFSCSNCGKFCDFDYLYCPNCGADMRGAND